MQSAKLVPKGGTSPTRTSASIPLESRKQAQLKTVDQFKVFYQFRFTDKLPESGITFVNRTLDDTSRHYKGVHYDRGNGIAVADVDGDGLYDIHFVNQAGENELWKVSAAENSKTSLKRPESRCPAASV